jgi:hypothetical protein
MTIRLYWSPIIGDGLSRATAYRTTAYDKPHQYIAQLITSAPRYDALGALNANWGAPKFTHALCIIKNDDWTAFDADPGEVLMLPDTGLNTRVEVLDAAKAVTVAGIPLAYRTKWLDVLTTLGVSTTDITGTTPFVRVLRRVLVSIDPAGANEDGLF